MPSKQNIKKISKQSTINADEDLNTALTAVRDLPADTNDYATELEHQGFREISGGTQNPTYDTVNGRITTRITNANDPTRFGIKQQINGNEIYRFKMDPNIPDSAHQRYHIDFPDKTDTTYPKGVTDRKSMLNHVTGEEFKELLTRRKLNK